MTSSPVEKTTIDSAFPTSPGTTASQDPFNDPQKGQQNEKDRQKDQPTVLFNSFLLFFAESLSGNIFPVEDCSRMMSLASSRDWESEVKESVRYLTEKRRYLSLFIIV